MNETETTPSPRIPLKLEVEYRKSYGRSDEMGQLKNISLTGAFLEHENEELKSSDKLIITFKVGGRVRKINASIIWSNGRGSGIRFLPTNNRDVQIVDDLMYFVESKRENRRSVLDDIFKQAA
ncbi:MAG: PilZ domain-containing protein [Bdellovibrionota bacterium]